MGLRLAEELRCGGWLCGRRKEGSLRGVGVSGVSKGVELGGKMEKKSFRTDFWGVCR